MVPTTKKGDGEERRENEFSSFMLHDFG